MVCTRIVFVDLYCFCVAIGFFASTPGQEACTEMCPIAGMTSPMGSTSFSNCTSDPNRLVYPKMLPYYETSDTDSASNNNAVDESIYACSGYTLRFSTCSQHGGEASGDYWYSTYTALRLIDEAGSTVASQTCCGCQTITHTFSGSCQTYTLRQGCYSNDQCTGKVAIAVIGKKPRMHVKVRWEKKDLTILQMFMLVFK